MPLSNETRIALEIEHLVPHTHPAGLNLRGERHVAQVLRHPHHLAQAQRLADDERRLVGRGGWSLLFQ